MTPKEKAEELFKKFLFTENKYGEYSDMVQSKQCALIAVDEMINAQRECYTRLEPYYKISEQYLFLLEVEQEIEKL